VNERIREIRGKGVPKNAGVVSQLPLGGCFLKQFSAEITISALLWGGFAAP